MKRKLLAITVAGSFVIAAFAIQQRTLVINSKIASTDVRIINGRAYAPIADIAKGLNMVVVTKGSSYELTSAGGTGQLNGLTGKTGEWLFDGGWRFRVNGCTLAKEFQGTFEYYGQEVLSAPNGKSLLIVDYSYRNGNRTTQPFCIGETAVATQDGQSFSLTHNNFNFDGSTMFSRVVLPGAEARGALVFVVPSDVKPKDLVLSVGDLAGYEESVKPRKPTVFRVGISLPDVS